MDMNKIYIKIQLEFFLHTQKENERYPEVYANC